MVRKIARHFLLTITIGVALLTLLSGWASLFDPEYFWYLALLGLGLPLLFICNFVLLLIWLVKRDKKAWIPGTVILLILIRLPLLYQFSGKPEKTEANCGESFSIMSFNIRLFDFYNWTHNHETRQVIMDFLRDEAPDIYCFQEFFSSTRKDYDYNNVAELMKFAGIKYRHTEYTITLYGTDRYGIATFSKHPIVGRGVLNLEPGRKSTNLCIYSDIQIGSDTVRVYNFHLQSVRLDIPDYKFIEELGQNPEETDPYHRAKTILRRLKNAFMRRSAQAELIASHIQLSPYPVILCGDMNDTPLSYSYKVVSEGLVDAFRESGQGFGFSYAGPIPGLRIDYLLHSPEISSSGFKTIYRKLSDHYPVRADFCLKK